MSTKNSESIVIHNEIDICIFSSDAILVLQIVTCNDHFW